MPEKHLDIDAYMKAQSGAGKAIAERIRAIIAHTVPDMTEAIKYNMPAFQISQKSFLYLAVWKRHVGLYPVYRGDAEFEKMLAPFRAEKDTVRFLFDGVLPEELVKKVATAQAGRVRFLVE